MMRVTKWIAATGAAGLVAASALAAGCGSPQRPAPAAPVPAAPAPKLEMVALSEKGAYPLAAHLESKDLAAGTRPFSKVFEDGALLFHTPYNGLDGVGIALNKGGKPVARFMPIGPKGPTAQACGECHNTPFPGAGGLAHSAVARDENDSGKAPFDGRSVTSLFGDGILQLLAQEMTE